MAVITISGGGGVVVADKCTEYGLDGVKLHPKTQERLREFFHLFGSVANPVDLTSQLFVDTTLFQRALRLVMQDPGIDVGGFFYNLEMPDPEAVNKIIEVYNEAEKPLIIFTWPTGQDYAVEAKKKLIQAGVPVIESIPSGLWAISALADWVKASSERRSYPFYQPGAERKKALKILSGSERGKALSEWRSKQILEAYGIPVTKEILARSPEEALAAAKQIGYPVAMKIMSPDLLHKSDIGGVLLNIADAPAVEKAYRDLLERAANQRPDAAIEGVLVQEMLKPGLEMIIGIKKDPVFGPAIVLGLGGVFVEVLKDVSTRVAPLREEDARAMLEELKGRALLEGARGSLPRDKDALVEVLVKVSRLAYEMEDLIQEMDINPLIVQARGDGAVAADALFVPVAQH